MEFVIPSSKNKRYLSGSDWIINALDYILKTETCAGNMAQVVITLDGLLDEVAVKSSLSRFTKKFPVLFGSIARDYNLVPYWRIPPKENFNLNFTNYNQDSPSSSEDMLRSLQESVNRQFRDCNDHVAFHLLRTDKQRSSFAMTFDHRLFDARGAEMFLNLFQRYLSEENNSGITDGFNFTAPAHLSQWMEKFYAGRNVNRKIVALSRTSMGALPLPPEKNKGFKFKLISLNLKETEEIYDIACNEAGYLMEMPYLLSVVIKSVHKLFKSRGMDPASYLVPVSIDMRSSEDLKQKLFFNHVSYLFFQIHSNDANDLPGMISKIKSQMYEQVKSGLPKDIQDASLLMRIAPPQVLKKIFNIPFNGKIASFCFSHVGKSSYLFSELMGAGINNIFHMPRVPVPPGLGFFFNYYNGRLNLIISYLDGLLSEDEVLMLETGLKEKLGACRT